MAEKFRAHSEFDNAFPKSDSLALPSTPDTNIDLCRGKKISNEINNSVDKDMASIGEFNSMADSDSDFGDGSNSDEYSIGTDSDELFNNWVNTNNLGDSLIDNNKVDSDDPVITECPVDQDVLMPSDMSDFVLDIIPESESFIPSGKEPVRIGSGVIVDILGSGGMAKVYKIWNEAYQIYRAVKLLLPTANTDNLQRFHTESKISANLKHPNIITVYDSAQWHGLPFMEMEYVEGVTLQVFLQFFKSLPPVLCSAITVQIARALAYAHHNQILLYGKKYRGIIHRDLKPSNIMIGFDGNVKLMDFGVARPVETGLHTVNIESIVGTLQYFPPEQVNGSPIDQLADIYSFGAVLYEMLCGSNPFPQLNLADLIRAKTINKYKRLHEYHMTIEPHLASLAQVCLRTEKHRRIQSSPLLKDYLEDLHYCWGTESPEDVIRSFFNSTETDSRKS